jgi:hypothetical protein
MPIPILVNIADIAQRGFLDERIEVIVQSRCRNRSYPPDPNCDFGEISTFPILTSQRER